jgi:hypothetical protein
MYYDLCNGKFSQQIMFYEWTATKLRRREIMPFGNSACYIIEYMISNLVTPFECTAYHI